MIIIIKITMGQKYLHLLLLNKPFRETELRNAVQFNQLELAINIYEQNTKVTTQNTKLRMVQQWSIVITYNCMHVPK